MNEYNIPNIIDDNFIKSFFFDNEKCICSRTTQKFLNRFPMIKTYLENRFKDSTCILESIWRIFLCIENAPRCPICNSKCKYIGHGKYTSFCSQNCAYSSNDIMQKRINSRKNKSVEEKQKTLNKLKETCIKRYGVDSYSKTNEYKEKYSNTIYKKYGVKHIFQSKEIQEKVKQTNLKNLGVEWPGQNQNCILKGQQTCLEKYGVNHNLKIPKVINHRNKIWNEKYGGHPLSSSIIIEKSNNTKQKLYGDKHYNNREKCKDTCLKKYNVEYIFQDDNFKQHTKQVLYEKYGNSCFLHSNKYKDFLINTYGVQNYSQTDEFKQKIYLTKKKHNSFHISKIEQQFKEYLEQNYPNDFEYQYRSNKYPFNCDFYIKSLDLYIEIQGSWTHGDHPFNENNQEDIEKLYSLMNLSNKLEQKGNIKNMYKNTIDIWTNKDVIKRTIAKNQNLNYLEIFSIDINKSILTLNEYIKNNKILYE